MPINSDIQQQVFDLLSRSSTISFVNAEQDTGTVLSLAPGQRVMAEVLASQAGTRTQVRVGGAQFNMELPMQVRQGQTLEMTFVAATPRPTFAIARQVGIAPPVSLSDASRLLGLLVGNEQLGDPGVRASLQSIGDLLRRSPGEAGVLANLMDEALTYGSTGERGSAAKLMPEGAMSPKGAQAGAAGLPSNTGTAGAQARLASFEANAAQMLQHIARNSRFTLTEAVNLPVTPLPLMPGEEVNAAVTGTLPGGRAFVQVAGTSLELLLPRRVQEGDILRLTFITSQPKPLFAIPRSAPGAETGVLSEAGRWLSVLEHSEGGVSGQQMQVLERLNVVLKNLPPDSPAYTAILDEAVTYQPLLRTGQQDAGPAAQAGAAIPSSPQPPLLQSGNGIVLSDDMAKLLQALVKGNRLALLEAINQQAAPGGLVPGQQMKSEVLASLGGGRFLLQVAGQAMEFNLPRGIQRGELLTLFYIASDPRPTFLMTRFGRPGDARLSETGRWLSGFLGATAAQAPVGQTMGILRTLLAAPPADAQQVGTLLQQGLRDSGLFYESHLARWFGGNYQLEDILREPQGRLSRLKLPVSGGAAPGMAGDEAMRPEVRSASLEVVESAMRKAGTALSTEAVGDQRALPVVREQLQTLQSGQIVFHGELFPGQPMEWAVGEREARRSDAGEQERGWDTSLNLELPRLGSISARLSLDGSRLSIDLRAGDADAAELLDHGRPALVEQLEAAGLVPGEIGVRHEAH